MGSMFDQSAIAGTPAPSPCTQGEGRGEGTSQQSMKNPLPCPLPEYRERECARRRGYVPLWVALLLAAIVVVLLAIWTIRSMSTETSDGRQTVVFWGAIQLGEDIYAVVNQFEHLPEN